MTLPVTRLLVPAVTASLTLAGPMARAARTAGGGDTAQIDVEIIETQSATVPDDFFVRARVTKLTPPEAGNIDWRYGGEGVGGRVKRGTFAEKAELGEWSAPVRVKDMTDRGRRLFLTVTCGTNGRRVSLRPLAFEGYSTGAEVEFEFSYRGRVVKTVTDRAPEGRTVGVVIPLHLLAENKMPDHPDFRRELTGLLGYEKLRSGRLKRLPWADWPVPRKYAIITNLGGYRPYAYYGVRISSREVVLAICETLRELGVNGLRGGPDFLREMIHRGEGIGAEFRRCSLVHGMGYPVPAVKKRGGKVVEGDPEAGCPFGSGVPELTKAGVEEALKGALREGVDEVWSLTDDEIGTVIDRSIEKKGHLAACPRCNAAFGEYLAKMGLQPRDFGQADWGEVKPLNVWDKASDRPWLRDKGLALAAYYTRRFNCYVSAKMFTELRDAFDEANARKRKALAAAPDSPEAKQPWVYSYALRGCTFLYSGHSLDFFNFYRHADNGFVYETSCRDPRIWSWDGYLCDVGRLVAPKMNLRAGIYIKPHRGAVVQRMLTAVSRGMKMIYWYTFGPEYAKGDSFAGKEEPLALTSKAAHLLGKVEDVLYGAEWARPAEVVVVNPRTSEIWNHLAAPPRGPAHYAEAKWCYTALAHAHVPVDALDEVMLAEDDLSRYKVMYILGSHLRRDAAEKVAGWVRGGGTLYTCAFGLARDEANEPLRVLAPVLGLSKRSEPEMWHKVNGYRAARLAPFDDNRSRLAPVPRGARVEGGAPFAAGFTPVYGREVLTPAPGTEVLAKFADGGAAVTRNRYGGGEAYVVGFFAGLEYSAKVRQKVYDMSRDFDEGIRSYVAAPALARTRPVVETSEPTVEGVLLKNPETGKQAVTVMNWTYRISSVKRETWLAKGRRRSRDRYVSDIAPFDDVKVTIRGAGKVAAVKSVMLDRSLPVTRLADGVTVTIPRLEEGDVLLLK